MERDRSIADKVKLAGKIGADVIMPKVFISGKIEGYSERTRVNVTIWRARVGYVGHFVLGSAAVAFGVNHGGDQGLALGLAGGINIAMPIVFIKRNYGTEKRFKRLLGINKKNTHNSSRESKG